FIILTMLQLYISKNCMLNESIDIFLITVVTFLNKKQLAGRKELYCSRFEVKFCFSLCIKMLY
ncbi:hypothetical protein, partial [Enterobacter cloacae complex sp. 2DZ2F20B]|uniref:hypothetical protein n=1 Tax=Enterobacter cloacae complex sp. 2DZ2F20B TaxID=2511993 RepID=UPI001CA53C18